MLVWSITTRGGAKVNIKDLRSGLRDELKGVGAIKRVQSRAQRGHLRVGLTGAAFGPCWDLELGLIQSARETAYESIALVRTFLGSGF